MANHNQSQKLWVILQVIFNWSHSSRSGCSTHSALLCCWVWPKYVEIVAVNCEESSVLCTSSPTFTNCLMVLLSAWQNNLLAERQGDVGHGRVYQFHFLSENPACTLFGGWRVHLHTDEMQFLFVTAQSVTHSLVVWVQVLSRAFAANSPLLSA